MGGPRRTGRPQGGCLDSSPTPRSRSPCPGRHRTPEDDSGNILRSDVDAARLDVGSWPGDDGAPRALFHEDLVPRPDDRETAPLEPWLAGRVEAMGEWMMPREAVRTGPDPRRALLDLLDGVWRGAVSRGGWDDAAHRCLRPAPPPRGQGRADGPDPARPTPEGP